MKITIEIYHTHMEVKPYKKGYYIDLEKRYSVYDELYHVWTPIAYYVDKENNILYLPRGADLDFIVRGFDDYSIIVKKDTDNIKYIYINTLIYPKSKMQAEGISFLRSEGRFIRGRTYSQLALTLDQGEGKTIAAILALSAYNCKTMVIVHKSKLKEQWKSQFLLATDIPEDKLIDLTSSNQINAIINSKYDDNGYIYFTTHQLLSSYANTYGNKALHNLFIKLGIGLKIIDEAHKFFTNTCMIDFFTNTKKTFYLTATFSRTNFKEKIMFKRAFSACYKFGEETLNYEEKRKHIIYYYTTFNSCCPIGKIPYMMGKYGISPHKYISYELYKDPTESLYNAIKIIMYNIKDYSGRVLITSPLIQSTIDIGNFIKNEFPNKRVLIINSTTDNSNVNYEDYDVISATMKFIGTGDDIKELRVLINTEPFSSEENTRQLKGRLREYSPSDYTFMFDLVDNSISEIVKMGNKRKRVMKKYALSVVDLDLG